VQRLKDLVDGSPTRLKDLVRGPFEVESGEDGNQTTMRMPPFMRQSNAAPLTLAAWQYALLMRWVEEQRAKPAAAPVAVAAEIPQPPAPPGPLSAAAAARQAEVLARLGEGRGE
jgi:hypothetical protein